MSNRDDALLLAGHSAGGALSMIAACELKHRLSMEIANLTFGAPQIFDEAAAEAFIKKIKEEYFYRCFINGRILKDPVPHMLSGFFQHPEKGGLPIPPFGQFGNPHAMWFYDSVIETHECKKHIEILLKNKRKI